MITMDTQLLNIDDEYNNYGKSKENNNQKGKMV